MIEVICGEKGKGKTKHLIDKVNKDMKSATGSIIYIDKSQKHMYELDSKIRLINMSDFPLETTNEFMGFLCGVLSQNNDIEEIFLDSFLTIGYVDTSEGLNESIEKLEIISDMFRVRFVISISMNEADLPDIVKPYLLLSL